MVFPPAPYLSFLDRFVAERNGQDEGAIKYTSFFDKLKTEMGSQSKTLMISPRAPQLESRQ